MSLVRFLVGGLALVAAQSTTAQAQEVVLYDGQHYQGRTLRLTGDAPNLNDLGYNDRASSIRIISGTWEFCKHARYRGDCFIASADQASIYGLDNRISSARLISTGRGHRDRHRDRDHGWDDRRDDRWDDRRDRRRDRGDRRRSRSEITLYSGPNFTGQSVTLSGTADNLHTYRFNDRARSIRVEGRGGWVVCQHAYFEGACMQVNDDIPYLQGGMAGVISSARPDSNSNRRGTRPREGVWLYDGRDFVGRRFETVYDVPNINDLGFNDLADSIVVARGETWEICEHARYRGRCEIVDSEGIADLARYGFQNRISSLRRVDGYHRR